MEWVIVFSRLEDLESFVRLFENAVPPLKSIMGIGPKVMYASKTEPSLLEVSIPRRGEGYPKEKKLLEMTEADQIEKEKHEKKMKELERRRKEEALLLEKKLKSVDDKVRDSKKMELKKALLEDSWKINYQELILEYILLSGKKNDLKIVENGLKLFQFISEFKRYAVEHVKNLIDELCLPPSLRANSYIPKNMLPPSTPEGMGIPSILQFYGEKYNVLVAVPEERRLVGQGENITAPIVDDGSVG